MPIDRVYHDGRVKAPIASASLLVAFGLLVAGCGGNGKSGAATTSPSRASYYAGFDPPVPLKATCAHPLGWQRLANRIDADVYCPGWLPDPLTSQLGGPSNNINVVSDGVQAMAFLRRQPPYEDVPKPDLMLLDLNLPKKDGREVLAEVKADSRLRRIPVVILTSSGADEDIERSYDDHANAYVQKGVDLDRFLRVVHCIDDFFGSVVRLPSQ